MRTSLILYKKSNGKTKNVILFISHAIRKLPLIISIIDEVIPHPEHSKPKKVFHKHGMR
jgi:hypothetical protein